MLRVIAGDLKKRLIKTPPDANTTRPLPDRVRTALFNILVGHLEGHDVVDCFAGCGSFGIEALSRGARSAVFIERDASVARLLESNIEELGLRDRATVVRADALTPSALAAAPRPIHVVMMDPPYPLMNDKVVRTRIMNRLADFADLLDDDGYAIVRTPWPFFVLPKNENDEERGRDVVDMEHPRLEGPETHEYGSTAIHLYMKKSAEA